MKPSTGGLFAPSSSDHVFIEPRSQSPQVQDWSEPWRDIDPIHSNQFDLSLRFRLIKD